MKHIFILNPVAGKARAHTLILPDILKEVKQAGVDYEIHRTINVGDASNYVAKKCKENRDKVLRFYAVGGDGTLNEVANGAIGHDNAEIAFIPAGTGNDFARIFTNYKYFNDIKRQLKGTPKYIDLIKCNDNYVVNMLNIGLDCDAALKAAYFKNKTFLKGQLAYIAGVLTVFVANKGSELTITLEDGEIHTGEFTLVAVGNGAFCGGGFKGVPKAKPDDGLLDVRIIRKVSR
ncbi:MAG: YegS/Rv2252/BmrU family lipid kinase, partial [Clostridiales bacterium]|nr:YegS/Rv2252/BmrU family lipid kinase [Clostridiales bacterium]